jgi:hypothetical protein
VNNGYRLTMHAAIQHYDLPAKLDDRFDKNEALIRKLSLAFPFRENPELGMLVRPTDKDEPRQRWFQYREGYSVSLCSQYIKPSDSLVMDPFCGFGSTLLAAKRAGVPSIGFDVNPLAAFVATTKTRTYQQADTEALRRIQAQINDLSETDDQASSPVIRILPKLFDAQILAALNAVKHVVERQPPGKAKDLAFLCWLSSLEAVSNAYREGNGLKYRNRIRRGNEYTTVPIEEWVNAAFPTDRLRYVVDKVSSAIDIALADIDHDNQPIQPRIFERDATLMEEHVRPASVSAAIFSPPYCNCFNYIKAYKLELWMGGFIKSYPDISRLTERGIRSRVESIATSAPRSNNKSVEAIARMVSQGDMWSSALPSVVRGYFADMTTLLQATHRALRKGGRATVVVGNSALAGVLIPTDLLLADIAQTVGFNVNNIRGARHLTTSSQQRLRLLPLKDFLRESVIELVK